MKKNLWKSICLIKQISVAELKKLGVIALLVCFSLNVYSQWTDYTVVGRVINENKQPVSNISIRVSPLGYGMDSSISTGIDGKFSLTKRTKKGDTWYLYASDYSRETEDAMTLIDPPFGGVNTKNRHFLGKPIKFSDEQVIDIGDIEVQFWFKTVYFKFQINGRNLKKKEWLSLWSRLTDNKGRILSELSVGPTIDNNQIDLKKSIMKLSLPEGKWKLEFQKYNDAKVKVYPKILGQTPYFIVDKDKCLRTIDLVISDLSVSN